MDRRKMGVWMGFLMEGLWCVNMVDFVGYFWNYGQ